MKITDILHEAEAQTYRPPVIKTGDEVKVGKFKNRKAEVKGFDTDDHGQPVLKTTKGDQKLFKPRISKLEPKEATDPGHETLLTMPNNTLVIDTPGELDWYKIGQHFPTISQQDPREFGQGESDMVVTFADELEMKKFIQLANKFKMITKDVSKSSTHPEIHSEKPKK